MFIKKLAFISLLSGYMMSSAVMAQGATDSVITVPSIPVGAAVSLGGTVVPYKDVPFLHRFQAVSTVLPAKKGTTSNPEPN